MNRWSRLSFATAALALLIAGGVRRWAKEQGWPPANESPQSEVNKAPYSPDAAPTGVVRAIAEQATPVGQQEPLAVRPAAAHVASSTTFPPPMNASADSAVYRAPFDPAPRPETRRSAHPYEPAERSEPTPEREALMTPANTPIAGAAPTHYVIQANDSFWTISQRLYGTGRYFQALFVHNRRVCPQPDHLPAGATIETPPMHVLEKAYPDLFR